MTSLLDDWARLEAGGPPSPGAPVANLNDGLPAPPPPRDSDIFSLDVVEREVTR